uniref:Uncharacterized protein n=1 Tax=Strongyloides stercoralis TaxID=6248 RepID=A0A0K0EIM4_STRER
MHFITYFSIFLIFFSQFSFQKVEVNEPLLKKALQLEKDAALLKDLAGNLNEKKEKLKEKWQKTNYNDSKDKHLEGVGHKTNDRRKLGSKYQKFAEKFGGFKN